MGQATTPKGKIYADVADYADYAVNPQSPFGFLVLQRQFLRNLRHLRQFCFWE
jgi:hypothetical protein